MNAAEKNHQQPGHALLQPEHEGENVEPQAHALLPLEREDEHVEPKVLPALDLGGEEPSEEEEQRHPHQRVPQAPVARATCEARRGYLRRGAPRMRLTATASPWERARNYFGSPNFSPKATWRETWLSEYRSLMPNATMGPRT